MGTFSKIQRLASWCFHPDESSQKYSTWAHPLFSILFGSGLSMASMIKLTAFLERKFPHLKGEFPEWAQKKLPLALASYLALMILSRVKYFGPVALYDFLWACNISLLLMIVGLLRKSNLMISCSMILIAIDQVRVLLRIISIHFLDALVYRCLWISALRQVLHRSSCLSQMAKHRVYQENHHNTSYLVHTPCSCGY